MAVVMSRSGVFARDVPTQNLIGGTRSDEATHHKQGEQTPHREVHGAQFWATNHRTSTRAWRRSRLPGVPAKDTLYRLS